MGHIQLSREADLVVVCPATADLMAKMAAGIADDLATTLLLATDKKVLAAPAMNVRMWQHAATRRNVAQLRDDGVTVIEPDEGEMACGEYGPGRLPEPEAIFAAIEKRSAARTARRPACIVTAGPTHEPIDPVRVHRQPVLGQAGLRHRRRARGAGRRVTLVTGPVAPRDAGRRGPIDVETAIEMDAAVIAALPADAAVLSRRSPTGGSSRRRQAQEGSRAARARLAADARHPRRPRPKRSAPAPDGRLRRRDRESTDDAAAKRARKGADWIVANDVSGDVMGGDANAVHLIAARRPRTGSACPRPRSPAGSPQRIADALA